MSETPGEHTPGLIIWAPASFLPGFWVRWVMLFLYPVIGIQGEFEEAFLLFHFRFIPLCGWQAGP